MSSKTIPTYLASYFRLLKLNRKVLVLKQKTQYFPLTW